MQAHTEEANSVWPLTSADQTLFFVDNFAFCIAHVGVGYNTNASVIMMHCMQSKLMPGSACHSFNLQVEQLGNPCREHHIIKDGFQP